MAFTTVTKILKKATPTVRTSDGVVKKWEIEVVYKNNGDAWTRSYPHTEEDLEYLNKTPEQFTSAQLIALMPSVLDTVFQHHWEAAHPGPAVEEKVANFDLSTLGTSSANTY